MARHHQHSLRLPVPCGMGNASPLETCIFDDSVKNAGFMVLKRGKFPYIL